MVKLREKKDEEEQEIENNGDFLTIPAFGRIAMIGTPYSEHTGTLFTGINIFTDPQPLNSKPSSKINIIKSEIQTTNIHKKRSHNIPAALTCLGEFTKINQDSEVNQNIEIDLKFEQSKIEEDFTKRMCLLYKKNIYLDTLDASNLSIHLDIGIDDIVKNATHFVAGIVWGADMEIGFEASITREAEEVIHEFNTCFETKGKTIKKDAENKEKFKKSEEVNDEDKCNASMQNTFNFEENVKRTSKAFHMSSHGFVSESKLPKHFEEANAIMKKVDSCRIVNDGKGVPLAYYIIPISYFGKSNSLNPLTIDFTKGMNKILDMVTNYQVSVSLVESLIREYSEFLPLRYENTTLQNLRKLGSEIDQLKVEVITTIQNFRQEGSNYWKVCSRIQKRLQKYKEVEIYATDMTKRVQLIKHVEKRGIWYAKRSSSIMNYLISNSGKSIFVYFADSWRQISEESIDMILKNAKIEKGRDDFNLVFFDKEMFNIFHEKRGLCKF